MGRAVWWCGCWGGPGIDRGSHCRVRGSHKRVVLGVHASGRCGMCPASLCAVPTSVAVIGVAVNKYQRYGGSSAIWWFGCHDPGGRGICQRALYLPWLLGRLAGLARVGWGPLVDRLRCWRPRPCVTLHRRRRRSVGRCRIDPFPLGEEGDDGWRGVREAACMVRGWA